MISGVTFVQHAIVLKTIQTNETKKFKLNEAKAMKKVIVQTVWNYSRISLG